MFISKSKVIRLHAFCGCYCFFILFLLFIYFFFKETKYAKLNSPINENVLILVEKK